METLIGNVTFRGNKGKLIYKVIMCLTTQWCVFTYQSVFMHQYY